MDRQAALEKNPSENFSEPWLPHSFFRLAYTLKRFNVMVLNLCYFLHVETTKDSAYSCMGLNF